MWVQGIKQEQKGRLRKIGHRTVDATSRSNSHTTFNMFARNVCRAMFAGRRPISTAGGQLPTSVLSLHRSFPYTLYKVNPGKCSNVVGPCSEHSYERDEVENLREGLVYPTITNSSLSPASDSVYLWRSDSNKRYVGRYFSPTHIGSKSKLG